MNFTGVCTLDVQGGVCDAGLGRRFWLHDRIPAEARVVDLGGTGELLDFHDPAKVTALDDLSGHGPGHAIRAGTFHKGDVCDLSRFADDEFDIAVMTEVLEHVPEPWRAMREAGRIARKMLITVPCEMRWQQPIAFKVAGHIRHYAIDTFALHLRMAGLDGEIGLLDFAGWSFFVAEVKRAG